MVEQCYYKKISESKVINLREALNIVNLDYKRCKACSGYNINCSIYEPVRKINNLKVGRLEEITQ